MKQPRMGNQLSRVLAFKDKGYLAYSKNTMSKTTHCLEPERNRSNKRHDATTVIRTFIVSNMIKTTRCDKSLTP